MHTNGRFNSTLGPESDSDLELDPLAEDVVLAQSFHQEDPPSPNQGWASPSWLNTPIKELSLSIRAENSLYYGGCKTVANLAGKRQDDFLKIQNFGQKSLDELIQALERHGIPFPVPANPDSISEQSQLGNSKQGDEVYVPSTALSLTDLGIPQTALGPLLRSGITTLGDLVDRTEQDLANIRNLGPKGIDAIREILSRIGLGFPFQENDLYPAWLQQNDSYPQSAPAIDDRKEIRQKVIAKSRKNRYRLEDLYRTKDRNRKNIASNLERGFRRRRAENRY
jgi:DNA-directed RNA polymerase alpha subunit